MTEPCARCGAPESGRKVYPPREWVEYLQSERGLSRLDGVLAIPLCADCNDRVAILREAFRDAAHRSADTTAPLQGRIETVLDDLDLDLLRDEIGPDPDDARSLF